MPSLIPTRRLTQPLGRVSRAKPRADDGSCWTSPTPISAGSAQGHAPVDIPSVPPRTAVDASTGDRRGWNAEQCLQRQPIHISQHTQSIGLQPTMSRGWDGNARAAPNIKVHWRGQPGVRDYTAACQSGDTIVLQHCPDLDCHSGSCALAPILLPISRFGPGTMLSTACMSHASVCWQTSLTTKLVSCTIKN